MSLSDVDDWIDFTADLLQEPLTVFPHERLAIQLGRSFPTYAVSWEWHESPTCRGGEAFSENGTTISPVVMREWHASELMDRHPLVQWFVKTGDPRAQTVDRVPRSVAPAPDAALMTEILAPLNVAQQLALPYLFADGAYAAFILGRPDDDFTDTELAVARRLQPLITGLSRQVKTIASIHGTPSQVAAGGAQVDLTGTELAVLGLLSQGHTAQAIAYRLGNSPRTVGKHLEHIYRKLHVSDRLQATLAARDLGLLPPNSSQHPEEVRPTDTHTTHSAPP